MSIMIRWASPECVRSIKRSKEDSNEDGPSPVRESKLGFDPSNLQENELSATIDNKKMITDNYQRLFQRGLGLDGGEPGCSRLD